MLGSLRSTLVIASFLWTGGLLALMHMLSIMLVHIYPAATRLDHRVGVLIGIVLMSIGVLVLRRGLKPFQRLRENLIAVRNAEDRRIAGAYPREVQPLVDDLNALLDHRQKAVKRALATAGDLAHGLKTPLALLTQEAERAGASGNPEFGESILLHVDRMARQVNYHLARARAAASGAAGAGRCPIAPCADAIVRTLLKLYADRVLRITADAAPELCARVQREDLDEILGNLLDNACKWATSTVILQARQVGQNIYVTVDDDGPGLLPDFRLAVLERGIRVDEAAPGSGLGLAIVRDLTEIYGGSISLETSTLGGLCARVTLCAF